MVYWLKQISKDLLCTDRRWLQSRMWRMVYLKRPFGRWWQWDVCFLWNDLPSWSFWVIKLEWGSKRGDRFGYKAWTRKHHDDSSYRITSISLWLQSDEIFATALFLCQVNPRGSLCAWQAEGKIKRIIRRMMNWTVNILGEKLQTHVHGLTKWRIPHKLCNALFRPFVLNFILKSICIHTIFSHFITSVYSDSTLPPHWKLKL